VDRGARRHRPRDAGPCPGRRPGGPGCPGPGCVRPVAAGAGRGRCDRLSPAGRVVLPGPGARPQRGLPLQGLQQDRTGLGVSARRGHRAPADRVGRSRRCPARHADHPHGADDRPGQGRAAPAPGHPGRRAVSAAVHLRRRVQRRRPHRRPGRLPRPPPSPPARRQRLLPGRAHLAREETAGPRTEGRRSTAWSRQSWKPPQGDAARGAARSRFPSPRNRTRPSSSRTPRSTAPSGPRPGTTSTPRSTATAAGSPAARNCPSRAAPLVHVTVERLPDGRDPHRQMWLWHAGPGPLSLDELRRAYLARFDIEHAIRTLKGTLGLTAAKVRAPEQADRWVQVVIAAHAQLLHARSLAADLHRPWEKAPGPGRPLPPGAGPPGGSATSAPTSGPPPVSRNPPGPGPAGPREAARDPRPATFSQAKPTCHPPRTRPPPGKRLKVKLYKASRSSASHLRTFDSCPAWQREIPCGEADGHTQPAGPSAARLVGTTWSTVMPRSRYQLRG
jgi:hypothetical protein